MVYYTDLLVEKIAKVFKLKSRHNTQHCFCFRIKKRELKPQNDTNWRLKI